jgi:hypothetical protein
LAGSISRLRAPLRKRAPARAAFSRDAPGRRAAEAKGFGRLQFRATVRNPIGLRL